MKLADYARLMRLDRPIGALLLLWPALWALWIAAEGSPTPYIVVVFVLGVAVTRSAGCVMNDYADREFDPHVARTRTRPLATGAVKPREAIGLLVALGGVAFALVLTLNWITVAMSVAGAVLACVYPFMKRFTHLPQFFLGLAFGWAVPMAFTAETGSISGLGWLVFLAAILWALVYDTIYAMVDRDDDLRIGVKSTAILFGDLDRLFVGIMQVLVLAVLVLVGHAAGLGGYYHAGLGAAAGLSIYQQVLIRDRAPTPCFRAFLNNNWFGAVVFAGVVADYTLA